MPTEGKLITDIQENFYKTPLIHLVKQIMENRGGINRNQVCKINEFRYGLCIFIFTLTNNYDNTSP